jgi:pyridoxine kinase
MTGARILALSSEVVYGPVGNSAAVPGLQSLGIAVLALPTVLLSNHPGHGVPVKVALAAADLAAMLDRVLAGGWLDGLAGILTGYFTDAGQVAVVAERLVRIRHRAPDVTILCDPILGDDHTGLYVPLTVAEAIRDRLVPLADVIAPNRFELAWLSGRQVHDGEEAVAAARSLAPALTLATSIPAASERLATMAISRAGIEQVETRRRARVPHGTGDLLSGLYLGHLVKGACPGAALAAAMARLEAVLDSSEGEPALDLTALNGLEAGHEAKP